MKDKAHKPLIVKGARQIGKTESILHFANENYHNVIYINFVLDKKYSKIVNDGYDVICSGSMLGINYKRIHSNSVGNKTDYEMYSMDFEEFLWAKGYQDAQIHEILNHMLELRPFSDTELQVHKLLFLDYCVLGGMPDVVRGYIETGTFSGSLDTQEQIRLDYEEDVRKYAQGLDQTKIISVYRSIPAQLAKENKKFQFNKMNRNARSREYTGCIEWLIDAGVITECNLGGRLLCTNPK